MPSADMPGWKYAFGLSRDAVTAATPPGTARIVEQSNTRRNGKYAEHITNYPVPSADPADPLNWPLWRKDLCLASLCLYAFTANFTSACIGPALPVWDLTFPADPKPFKQLMLLVSSNILLIGLGNTVWVPLANVYGRRPVLLVSALVLFVASICGISPGSFASFLGIRVFQGVGSSAAEAVAIAAVGDMYFIIIRSRRMVFYAGAMATGSIAGNLCGGYIGFRLGWLALFEISAALSASTLLSLIFLSPETIYDRDPPCLPVQRNLPRASRYFPKTPAPHLTLNTLPSMRMTLPSRFLDSVRIEPPVPALTWYDDNSSDDQSSSMSSSPIRTMASRHRSKATRSSHATGRTRYRPYTFSRSLRLGMNRGNLLYQFSRPWSTLRLPTVWIAALQYAGLVGSLGVVSLMGPTVLLAPPYFWGIDASLLSVGSLVGVVLGGLYSYFLPDLRVKKKALKNVHGFVEPEYRIPVILPSLALATAGLLAFGFCADYPDSYQWVGIEVACGMVSFGLVQVATVWYSYFIDAFSQLASDALVMVCLLRGVFPFAFTFFSSDWVKEDGFLVPFGGFTVIMGIFSLLIVPFIWTGKRMRIATARYVVHNQ